MVSLRTSAKCGDFAITARSWVRLVMYNATPGTFLQYPTKLSSINSNRLLTHRMSEGAVPLHRPFKPSFATMSRAVHRINVVFLPHSYEDMGRIKHGEHACLRTLFESYRHLVGLGFLAGQLEIELRFVEFKMWIDYFSHGCRQIVQAKPDNAPV
jgi:hypothetical protein